MHKLAMTASALLLAATASTAGNRFNIDVLEQLGRVSAPCVAPNGKTVLFGVSYENLAENNSNNDLYLVTIGEEKSPVKITDTPKSESSAIWIAGGDKIAFIYPDAEGNAQMWTMNPDGNRTHHRRSDVQALG